MQAGICHAGCVAKHCLHRLRKSLCLPGSAPIVKGRNCAPQNIELCLSGNRHCPQGRILKPVLFGSISVFFSCRLFRHRVIIYNRLLFHITVYACFGLSMRHNSSAAHNPGFFTPFAAPCLDPGKTQIFTSPAPASPVPQSSPPY